MVGFGYAADGALKMGPKGLGMLLTGSYVGDARVLYCPSSDGLCDNHPVAKSYAYRLADWRKAGGFDARALTHGEWPQHLWGSIYWTSHRAVLSHYAYRNTQVVDAHSGGTLSTGADYNAGRQTKVPWTRPGIVTENLAPSFKTVKLQGGRALASDTFNKLWEVTNPAVATFGPGVGDQGHRDGYTVLYGDNHVQWHGDPQRKIIWWSDYHAARYGLDRMWTRWNDHRNRRVSAFHVWHLLDEAAGVDVGVRDPDYSTK